MYGCFLIAALDKIRGCMRVAYILLACVSLCSCSGFYLEAGASVLYRDNVELDKDEKRKVTTPPIVESDEPSLVENLLE